MVAPEVIAVEINECKSHLFSGTDDMSSILFINDSQFAHAVGETHVLYFGMSDNKRCTSIFDVSGITIFGLSVQSRSF